MSRSVDQLYQDFLKAAREQRKKIGQMLGDGLSLSEIGKELNLSRQRIYQIKKRYFS